MANNFQFVDVPRIDPIKVPANQRKQEFKEIYGELDAEQAADQADRAYTVETHIVNGNAPA